MGNEASYHIFLITKASKDGEDVQGIKLRHIFPPPGEICDEKDVAVMTFDLTSSETKGILLVKFKRDQKTKEVSYSIVKKNFTLRYQEDLTKLEESLKDICVTKVGKLF